MEQPIPTVQVPVEPNQEVSLKASTKTVKNFWERLDEVFTQNTQLRDRMEELLENFPNATEAQKDYKSFIFQPERLAISSNDDITGSRQVAYTVKAAEGHKAAETFSSFRIRLLRPLRNVKNIQLLSAVVPNATQNIPDNSVIFFYYRIRPVNQSLQGAWDANAQYLPGDIVNFLGNYFVAMLPSVNYQPVGGQLGIWWLPFTLPANQNRPNYYDLNPWRIQAVFLTPTFAFPPEETNLVLLYNRTFVDYPDLVSSLNFCADSPNASFPKDVTFAFQPTLNKMMFVPSPGYINSDIYYLPCGYEDPNIELAMANSKNPLSVLYPLFNTYQLSDIFAKNYNLNLRLGFTWNGVFPNPFTVGNIYTDDTFPSLLYFYLRARDPALTTVPVYASNVLIANNYGDLVNTSCVRVYADFALGSTQDSLGSTNTDGQPVQQGLLSIIPVNANNLGVAFYQNNFNNPLTKIPQNITEIGITMLNDQGLPYLLPNSATVLLELALEYR